MKSDDSEASKSEEEKEEMNEEEEEQEEQEQEEKEEKDENQEEKQDENQEEENEDDSEHINVNELDNPNSFIISLQLIKKFDGMHQGDTETIIIDFLKNVGLPMHLNNEETLALYLYFNKMCIPFYKLLKNIKSDKVSEIVLNSLKESYYLLADNEIRHYNYTDIAKKSFSILRMSE